MGTDKTETSKCLTDIKIAKLTSDMYRKNPEIDSIDINEIILSMLLTVQEELARCNDRLKYLNDLISREERKLNTPNWLIDIKDINTRILKLNLLKEKRLSELDQLTQAQCDLLTLLKDRESFIRIALAQNIIDHRNNLRKREKFIKEQRCELQYELDMLLQMWKLITKHRIALAQNIIDHRNNLRKKEKFTKEQRCELQHELDMLLQMLKLIPTHRSISCAKQRHASSTSNDSGYQDSISNEELNNDEVDNNSFLDNQLQKASDDFDQNQRIKTTTEQSSYETRKIAKQLRETADIMDQTFLTRSQSFAFSHKKNTPMDETLKRASGTYNLLKLADESPPFALQQIWQLLAHSSVTHL